MPAVHAHGPAAGPGGPARGAAEAAAGAAAETAAPARGPEARGPGVSSPPRLYFSSEGLLLENVVGRGLSVCSTFPFARDLAGFETSASFELLSEASGGAGGSLHMLNPEGAVPSRPGSAAVHAEPLATGRLGGARGLLRLFVGFRIPCVFVNRNLPLDVSQLAFGCFATGSNMSETSCPGLDPQAFPIGGRASTCWLAVPTRLACIHWNPRLVVWSSGT